MKKYLIASVALLFFTIISRGQSKKESLYPYTLSITPRINSAGYFPFTGAILNRNTNVDLNVIFQKRGYGFLAFKSLDLEDKKSDINYLQSAVFKQFRVSKTVQVGLFFGYLFSQISEFKDVVGSDYFGAWTVYWDINKKLRLENIMLITDVSTQQKIVNRILILYTVKKFRLNLSLHQREVPEINNFSASGSFGISLPKLKIVNKVSTQFTAAYQTYITANRPDFALKDGFLFSLAFPIEINQ